MLHLAIICIVCAAFAPSDSTAFNGQKKNESDIVYNFEGGEQNVAKVSFPSVYNVVGRNSSVCAKPGITFFYDYFIQQYQNSKSNSCSIMERVPLRENKNLHSNVDFVYRKRNLLWVTEEKKYQPKPLRPAVPNGCCCSNQKPAKTEKRRKFKLDFLCRWRKRKGGQKTGKANKESIMKAESKKLEKCTLSPKEKKLFLCLKRGKGQKNYRQKANLGTLQVEDDLDLNKRIKKLVEELAVENHRKKERLEERIRSERRESEVGHENLKKEDELSPILTNIKQMFMFNKNTFNDRIVGNTKRDPVSSMRVRFANPGKAENTVSSYDILRTMRKTIRLRRNTHKSHNSNECIKNRGPKYKNNLTGWSNPYSANFKANVNFLYPQKSRKFFPENAKKRRWMKMRMRRNRQKKGLRDWPILKRTFEKLYGSDSKPTCQDKFSDSKPAAMNKPHQSCTNSTGPSQTLSLKDETVNCISDAWKDSELPFKIISSYSRVHEQGERTTENPFERVQPEFLLYSMEKPLLQKQLTDEKLKVIKDIDRFVTEGPSTHYLGLQAYNLVGGIENHINPLRYLKFRHILRDNIDGSKVEDPKRNLYKRKKRHRWKFSSAPNKHWKSAPVLCTSYIRKGQEDQLKCLIKLIQNMMGRHIPLTIDSFQQPKYRPSCGKRRNAPRDFGEEGEPNYPSSVPYLYSSPSLYSKIFRLLPHSRFPIQCQIPYEPVKPGNFHNLFDPPSTLSPSTILPGTTSWIYLHQPQNAVIKSSYIPISSPVRKGEKRGCSSTEQVASSSLDSNSPVTHASQTASEAPKFSLPAKAVVALNANIPAPTALPCSASARTAPPDRVSTSAYKCPHETDSSPRPLPESPTECSSRQHIQPSTVNSHVLQESESQNENEGAPSEEPQIPEDNPMAVRLKQQPNSESVDSQYPGSNAGFKDTEMHNFDYFSRIRRSKNEESRRKLEMIQKLFGNEAAFRGKRFHRRKKGKSKSNSGGHRKCSCFMKYFRKQYDRILRKGRTRGKKTKAEPIARCNHGNKPLDRCNSSSVQDLPVCGWQQQNSGVPMYSTPVYVNADYLPIYDHQTQKIIHQSYENPKQIKSENLLPIFGRFHLDANPYAYGLNPPPQQNENYLRKFAAKPIKMPPLSYDMEPQEQVFMKRQKRSDEYYVWPENDYSDYFYDPREAEEDSENLLSLNESPSETWTPPSYDMFRELAKAVTQNEYQRSEDKKTKVSELISTVKPLTSTCLLSLSGPSNATKTHVTTNLPSTEVLVQSGGLKGTEEPLTTTDAAAAKVGVASPPPTSVTTTTLITTGTTTRTTTTATTATAAATASATIAPAATTPTNTTAAATVTATTVGGKRGRPRGGKKSHERFSKHSGNSKNLVDSRDEKVGQIEELVPAEDIHGPTTLKAAAIVRGQKKFQGKPSPKVYMKVYPDSFEKSEQGGGETLIPTTARAAETINIVKSLEQGAASIRTDLRLQILAVCEGYLEVVKLIKAQNQTLAEDTDENLARYCENIISQHFNCQSEKSKKFESNELLTPTTNKIHSEKEADSNDGPELYEDFISPYDSNAFPNEHFHGISASDNSDSLISKRKSDRNLTPKSRSRVKRRKKGRKVHRSSRKIPKLRRIRKKKDAEEVSEGKGTGKEQKELIRLLRKRKKALLSWLLTTNDGIKPDDLQETEYFDEEDLIDPESDTAQYSGTIKPRRDETLYRTKKKNKWNSKDTFYPVYAKDYGYESGGELIEVEVLWRQVNEKTHENKIFKNLSVLALFLTSTPSPKIKPEETKLVGDDNEGDTDTKWKKNKLAVEAAKMEAETDNLNTSSTSTKESTEICTDNSTENSTPSCRGVHKNVKISNKPKRKNETHTIISKPDPTSIVGAPTFANKSHRKISHKYGVAKDIFQEYSIEFLNYAVYILPMMFTVLFLLCCLCCALQIFKIQKSHKKRKKKKKKVMSSDDTSVSCTSETELKKRKRDTKRKRGPGSKENYESTHKKKSKTFWNYLKVYNKPSREMDEEIDQTEKKKSFLGFLKGKREEGKPGYCSAPMGETDDEANTSPGNRVRKHYSDQYLSNRHGKRERHRKEEQGEAAERRELIALLEELKKIETEHIETKKEVKSVQVQYAIPEYDNSLFQPKSQIPDFSYPYEKNVFGVPKGICPFYNKKFQFHPTISPSSRGYDLYEEVNELTKLLPWEYYPQRNNFLKRCDIKTDRFLKIFRDSGMNCNRPVVEKNCKTKESESRSFIFNKYRSVSVDKSEELMGVSTKISGTEVRLMENVSPSKLSSNRDEGLVEDVENLKCQLNKKKYVRLKDEGVLCRL